MTARRTRRSLPATARDLTTTNAAAASTAASPRDVPAIWFAVLVIATFAAYWPAWFGGPLWDDHAHMTAPALRSLGGLWRIWTELGATQQYYPVAHSTFWLLHAVAGEHTLPHHLASIGFHAASACVLIVLLRRLTIPGAVLAATVFALHPVHVESVAWISEIKNTLSGLLYLLAGLRYLRFAASRRRSDYALALTLFVLALLTKSVTASLPAALLLVFWWQRGRLSWATDVKPLIPFFILAIGFGLLTAWVERTLVGATGEAFQLTAIDRVQIAGRAVWFYLSKLAWPAGLAFIYPRWDLSAHPLNFLYPLAALAILAILWAVRARSRAPLAAALFFGGTLTPALGFFDVYPFRYAFVADHFQYLASLGPIVLAAAALATVRGPVERFLPAVAAVVGLILGTLTWQHSRAYKDAETLYHATLQANPSCWLCLNNLARLNIEKGGDPHQSLTWIDETLRLNPRVAEAHDNRSVLLLMTGRHAEALAASREAVRLDPRMPVAQYHLGAQLQAAGRMDEALRHYLEAARLDPTYADAHNGAGAILQLSGRVEEAIGHITAAMQARPTDPKSYDNLGTAYARLGQFDRAIAEYRRALQQDPDYLPARTNLATALASSGQLTDAIKEYEIVVHRSPGQPAPLDNLAFALLQTGRTPEALARAEEAVRVGPDYLPARLTLGSALIAAGRGAEAIPHLERAATRPDLVDAQLVKRELDRARTATRR